MEVLFQSTKPETLAAFLGKHLFYTYENGWQFEMYIKNAQTIDYRVHSGLVAGRWVRDQQVHIARLADEVCKISWDEPTGTSVSVAINFAERQAHGVIFFPQWIAQDPKKTACFQNDVISKMRAYRDAGPTYPKLVVDKFARITFIEDCGQDVETVIHCSPSDLPEGFLAQRA